MTPKNLAIVQQAIECVKRGEQVVVFSSLMENGPLIARQLIKAGTSACHIVKPNGEEATTKSPGDRSDLVRSAAGRSEEGRIGLTQRIGRGETCVEPRPCPSGKENAMSDPTHVYGACKYTGDIADAQRILQEWGMIGLLIPLEQSVFVLDGPYHVSGIGPRGPVKEEDLQDCLNEIADAVRIQKAEFRCYGPEPGQVWDLIHVDGRFIRVPLELQPTLEALDDPTVREYYGVEYSLV